MVGRGAGRVKGPVPAEDRFLHHAHVVVMDSKSYRNPRNRTTEPAVEEATA